MSGFPEIYKKDALIEQLKRHESGAAKIPHKLEFYILDERQELKRIESDVLFVRTGEKSGFSILPTWRADACALYSYPHSEKNGDFGSSFSTKHRCGNVFDVVVEVGRQRILLNDPEE